ncbi:MAG: hypothetical protein ACOVO9_12560, partial [Bacteroidia bacterium]
MVKNKQLFYKLFVAVINPKTYIPQPLKFPLWFITKAPQRKLGLYTLFLDIKGIFQFLIYSIIPVTSPKPISICVGLKNRSEIFLKNFIKSLNNCKNLHLIELSVYDCNSTDIPDLENVI